VEEQDDDEPMVEKKIKKNSACMDIEEIEVQNDEEGGEDEEETEDENGITDELKQAI